MPNKKYNLKKDHTAIKSQIKEWELEIDKLVNMIFDIHKDPTPYNQNELKDNVLPRLEELSDEMMAINI